MTKPTNWLGKSCTLVAFFFFIGNGTAIECYKCIEKGTHPEAIHNNNLDQLHDCVSGNYIKRIADCKSKFCQTSVTTGQWDKDKVKWTVSKHDCGYGISYPSCRNVSREGLWGNTNVVETICSCGKDLCNYRDAKGDKKCTYCEGGISKSEEPGRSGTLDGVQRLVRSLTCKEWIAYGKPRHGQHVEANCYDGHCYTQTESIVKYSHDKKFLEMETSTSMGCREESTSFSDNTCQNVTQNWKPRPGYENKDDFLFLSVQECRCDKEHCSSEEDYKNTTESVERSLNEWKEMRKAQGHNEEIVEVPSPEPPGGMKCVQCWDKNSYFKYTDDDRRMAYRQTNEHKKKDFRCHDRRVSTSCNGYCFAATHTIVVKEVDKENGKEKEVFNTWSGMDCREGITNFTDKTCQDVTQERKQDMPEDEKFLFMSFYECRCDWGSNCASPKDLRTTQDEVSKAVGEWVKQNYPKKGRSIGTKFESSTSSILLGSAILLLLL